MNKCLVASAILTSFGLLLFSFSETKPSQPEVVEKFEVPYGLPEIPWPKDNPYSKAKADLGQLLYFDKRLSGDGTVSCATCHTINDAFAERKPVSIGIKGHKGTRNAPTVINAAYNKFQFWDGRAKTLEEQCLGPIANPKEMALYDDPHVCYLDCLNRIKAIKGYHELFKQVFGDEGITMENIAKAIATFERTVLSGNSPYDRYIGGDKTAMTEEQIYGYKLFEKKNCINCHNGVNFSDDRFFNIGVGMDEESPDLGRYWITHNTDDWGSFKVPTLREVANTYPYMHDGKYWTLEDVINFYDKGGVKNRNLPPIMRPMHLTEKEKAALIAFMKALNGEGWQHFKEPEVFPQ